MKEGDSLSFATDDENERALWVQAVYRATGQTHKPVPPMVQTNKISNTQISRMQGGKDGEWCSREMILPLPYLTWSRGYVTFSCSTQLSMKFIMLIMSKCQQLYMFLEVAAHFNFILDLYKDSRKKVFTVLNHSWAEFLSFVSSNLRFLSSKV